MESINIKKLVKQALEKAENLFQNQRYRESEIVLNQLLKVNPKNFKALQLAGLCCHRKSKSEKAIEYFNKSLEEEPNNSENHNNISICYAKLGKLKEAKSHIIRAIELNPNNGNYHSNFGLQCRQAGNIKKAIDLFKKAIELNPESQYFQINLGSAYGHLKELDKAIICFKKSIQLKDIPSSHVDLAYAYHLKGDMNKAWKEYEYRLEYFPQMKKFQKEYGDKERWDGKSDLAGKKIVVYCEQGAGDLIQFVRFLKNLLSKNCEILLHVPEKMENLFAISNERNIKIATSHSDEEYDYHCSIMSLPYLLSIESVESKPYIMQNNKIDLSEYSNYFKVGIVWGGNPQHPNDLNRSCPLRFFKPLSEIPGVKLFGIQKDLRKRAYPHHPDPIDLTFGCEDMNIVDMSNFLKDFNDTAAVIEELDLVITVDTAILHLAGAMGKKTWALIPYNPDWRWLLEGNSTDWYPSMRLFRQDSFGDWASVFEKATLELKNIAG